MGDPDALVSQQALTALERAADAVPGGERMVDGLLGTAREALAGAVQTGFLFVLFATVISIAGALLMQNLRLTENPATVGAPGEAAAAGASAGVPREPRLTEGERIQHAEGRPGPGERYGQEGKRKAG